MPGPGRAFTRDVKTKVEERRAVENFMVICKVCLATPLRKRGSDGVRGSYMTPPLAKSDADSSRGFVARSREHRTAKCFTIEFQIWKEAIEAPPRNKGLQTVF